VNPDRKAIVITALIVMATLVALFLAGCTQSRTVEQTETQKIDKVTLTGTVPMAGADGAIVQAPVSFTLHRTGTEQADRQAETKSGIDGAAIGREIAAALGPVMSAAVASSGVPWAQILGGAGTAVVAATTGYLAIAKRGQIKGGKA
jgi:hypothetical protein